MPFIKIVEGKTSEGIEVSQILKSLWREGGAFSKILSSSGINEGARWQFYSNTQNPFSIASTIAFSANSPYPYPREI